MAKRSKGSGIPAWALALGAGAGVYFLTRGTHATAMPPLPTPVSNPQPSTPRRTPRPTDQRGDATTTEAVVRRLMADTAAGSLARQVFYVQSVLYSYGNSDIFPDGVLGPRTWDAINSARAVAHMPQSTQWDASVPTDVVQAVKARLGELSEPRILPFSLPASVIDRINREIVPLAGRGAPVLQAYAV